MHIHSDAPTLHSLYVWGYLHTQTSYSKVITLWKIISWVILRLFIWSHRSSSQGRHNLFASSRTRKRLVSETQEQPSCVCPTGSYSQTPCQSIRVHPPGQGSKIAPNPPRRDEDVLVHKELGLNWGGMGRFLAVPKISLYPWIGQ